MSLLSWYDIPHHIVFASTYQVRPLPFKSGPHDQSSGTGQLRHMTNNYWPIKACVIKRFYHKDRFHPQQLPKLEPLDRLFALINFSSASLLIYILPYKPADFDNRFQGLSIIRPIFQLISHRTILHNGSNSSRTIYESPNDRPGCLSQQPY
jgi:hypothetical protein